jgi:hypothetical protein
MRTCKRCKKGFEFVPPKRGQSGGAYNVRYCPECAAQVRFEHDHGKGSRSNGFYTVLHDPDVEAGFRPGAVIEKASMWQLVDNAYLSDGMSVKDKTGRVLVYQKKQRMLVDISDPMGL